MGSRGFCSEAPRCVHRTPPRARTSEHMSCVCSPPEASACLLCPSPEGRGGATGIGNVREASYQPSSRGSVPLQVPLAGALQHEPPDAEWPGPLWHPATTRGTRGQPLAPPVRLCRTAACLGSVFSPPGSQMDKFEEQVGQPKATSTPPSPLFQVAYGGKTFQDHF